MFGRLPRHRFVSLGDRPGRQVTDLGHAEVVTARQERPTGSRLIHPPRLLGSQAEARSGRLDGRDGRTETEQQALAALLGCRIDRQPHDSAEAVLTELADEGLAGVGSLRFHSLQQPPRDGLATTGRTNRWQRRATARTKHDLNSQALACPQAGERRQDRADRLLAVGRVQRADAAVQLQAARREGRSPVTALERHHQSSRDERLDLPLDLWGVAELAAHEVLNTPGVGTGFEDELWGVALGGPVADEPQRCRLTERLREEQQLPDQRAGLRCRKWRCERASHETPPHPRRSWWPTRWLRRRPPPAPAR